ncbi:endonuclease V [Candidatus Woesearchaeota archaeon]|jgi:deoxyribonuclease V|nr:endonuclease V [Candidatus Woesearchaeota archaeon]MBT5272259.1 endonuclease V [Candidatus Woesearchaeota archaeon]MBT6041148.1 endonuclease V [Candidatus Woesearchaeota archaeon]MBT6336531.1 endonuclease V [Candidatus Woesearchaeota archaeon]MBT7927421.1 endonuclease V [Candidatus Woesearchaeota archaeon]
MLNIEKLKEEQLKLAKKLSLSDQFDKIKTIAGVDYLYTDDEIICTIVVINYKTLEVVEKIYAVEKATFPYISGFISYRITPVTVKAYEKLENKPDLMMISANGIMHPRMFGAASALGLYLDIPTIGVAKKRLCGEEKDNCVYLDKDVIGKKIGTKDKAKAVYVSQGHKVGIKTTMEIVQNMLKGHKLPEPLYLAHKYGNKVKSKLKEDNTNIESKSDENEDTLSEED